jgi:hypothetical protein
MGTCDPQNKVTFYDRIVYLLEVKFTKHEQNLLKEGLKGNLKEENQNSLMNLIIM